MSLVKDLKEIAQKHRGKKDEKNVADIGAAAEVEEKKDEDVLLTDKKGKLKENISIRLQSDPINMSKKIWYNPSVELIVKKGTEVKLIKEMNASMLIDIPVIGVGTIRINVPTDILSKGQKKSKLKQ